MKTCSDCKAILSLDRFHRRGSGHQPVCIGCKKARDSGRYAACDKNKYKRIRREGRERRAAENRLFVVGYLKDHPCTDCGESDIVVLEFDHIRGIKAGNVSEMVTNGYVLDKVKQEVEKCEVVCANCHRRRTAQRGQFFRTTI